MASLFEDNLEQVDTRGMYPARGGGSSATSSAFIALGNTIGDLAKVYVNQEAASQKIEETRDTALRYSDAAQRATELAESVANGENSPLQAQILANQYLKQANVQDPENIATYQTAFKDFQGKAPATAIYDISKDVNDKVASGTYVGMFSKDGTVDLEGTIGYNQRLQSSIVSSTRNVELASANSKVLASSEGARLFDYVANDTVPLAHIANPSERQFVSIMRDIKSGQRKSPEQIAQAKSLLERNFTNSVNQAAQMVNPNQRAVTMQKMMEQKEVYTSFFSSLLDSGDDASVAKATKEYNDNTFGLKVDEKIQLFGDAYVTTAALSKLNPDLIKKGAFTDGLLSTLIKSVTNGLSNAVTGANQVNVNGVQTTPDQIDKYVDMTNHVANGGSVDDFSSDDKKTYAKMSPMLKDVNSDTDAGLNHVAETNYNTMSQIKNNKADIDNWTKATMGTKFFTDIVKMKDKKPETFFKFKEQTEKAMYTVSTKINTNLTGLPDGMVKYDDTADKYWVDDSVLKQPASLLDTSKESLDYTSNLNAARTAVEDLELYSLLGETVSTDTNLGIPTGKLKADTAVATTVKSRTLQYQRQQARRTISSSVFEVPPEVQTIYEPTFIDEPTTTNLQ